MNFMVERKYIYTRDSEYSITTCTGFPEIGYLINLSFRKKVESGVEGIGGDSADGSAVPMYNL